MQIHPLQDAPQTARLLIARKADFDWTAQQLSAAHQAQLETQVSKNNSFVAFFQDEQWLFVEILPESADAIMAKEQARKKAASRLAQLRSYQIEGLRIEEPAHLGLGLAYAEGLALANYQFLKYKQEAEKKRSPLQKLYLAASADALEELQIVLDATFAARDLVNEPLSYLTALQLSKEIERLGAEAGFNVEVLHKDQIEALKMGGLLAVNKGSFLPPTFSILEWNPENAQNEKPVVLVGKGVVYDTGGMSLKPTPNSMDFMKADMGGAAAVIAATYAAAKAKLPLHIVTLVPATDNRPGHHAYVPGDVIQMHSGHQVEVLNTDAEGRLLLADALHYAKRYQPELVMDFATLTGAAARAIGTNGIVFMGTADEGLKKQAQQAGLESYERLVEFPIWEEYGEQLKSEIADFTNLGGPMGGAITAGKFLQHFTDYPWLHFDIAGPAFVQQPENYRPKGGTGVGTRLLFAFLKTYQNGN